MGIAPDEVFAAIERDRESGELPGKVTTARFVYSGTDRPSVLEQIDRETGQRRLGTFENRVFTPLGDEQRGAKERPRD